MRTPEAAEDYLEAILVLKQEKGYSRGVDIARHLGVSKPCVSRAMSNLRERGQISVNEDNFISLTPEGEAIARRVYDRHCCLTRWFIRIGISPEVAAADACRIEHSISEETFAHLKRHFDP